ncbi:MAG: SDR family NAD(P)-dependent oxidoreductase [Candidatus Omnitrophica bacterium]|jgi:NAD(P)-dependent dehydrogenase (short-subunit alcohol dehydrogenase family)|nr:SDR family NAD(P)-dependent oxidoreductase [Candidatus Omnitrophota bacterium]
MIYYIVIGSSRGLGSALVEELLRQEHCQVIGVARTTLKDIKGHEKWIASGRYRHVEADISSSRCHQILSSVARNLSPSPICIIFNSAHIEKDINPDNKSINYVAFERVNRVGIDGLGNILFIFQEHLLRYGGVFVGISSFWGTIPPLFLPWVAYPASKAYLNIALRCLRVWWRGRIKVLIVNIGNIGKDTSLPKWIVPTYSMAARKIIYSLSIKKIPRVINYPFWHAVVYLYILRFIPEIFYLWIFKLYFRFQPPQKKSEKSNKIDV